ncbi:hypothetical protein OsJ_00732 [Oryza sativa Japonica Group]|uniref:Late embryogenesis abundant protein LEA-2 subgroup domain-containing protein n=1 Tax=Oryza sativa subsp. japonica TaxID=39947 RepID=A2ZQ91_ORYSJ|nr:hypothetical protein OsJ_00732 [Oryza sativa Japonica Group]
MSSNGKPNPPPAASAAAAAGNGAGGPPKMYQRPIYRPQAPAAKRRRGGRSSCRFSCCCCFFYAVLVVLLLAFVAAVAGGAFYLLYRPHRPAFTLSVARVDKLSLSSSATAPTLTDSIDVKLTAKNPNKKLVYLYDDFAVTAATGANAATVSASALGVDPTTAATDIKKSGEFTITLDLETKAGVKVGGLKTKKIGVLVHCEGIKVAAPAPPPPPAKKKKGGVKLSVSDAPSPAASVDDTTPSPPPATTVARVCQLSLSSSATAPTLTDSIDVTLTAKNPNKKLVYLYDDFAVTAATAANAVPLGEGSVPGFVHDAGNITVIKATVSASALGVDPTTAATDIKKSGEFTITLDLETKAGVKVGGLKTKKIGVLVHCEGIKVAAPAPPPPPAKKKKGGVKLSVSDAPSPAASVDYTTPSPAAGEQRRAPVPGQDPSQDLEVDFLFNFPKF